MEDRGEMEFFDFVPVHFVNELETNIQDIITMHFNSNRILLDSCKKNMFIFKNFVLRNIFKFPSIFVFERKKSDLVIDKKLDCDRYINNKDRHNSLTKGIQDLSKKISYLKNKNNNLTRILEYKEEIQQATCNIKSMKDQYKKLIEYVNGLPFFEFDDENFNYLLEYRGIRTDVLKKEWNDINNNFDIELL